MINVFVLLHESNNNGEVTIDVKACVDFKTAKDEMSKAIDDIITKHYKYEGIDLDDIEKHQGDGDCPYTLERKEESFFIGCNFDDYHEEMKIVMKPLLGDMK